MKPHPQREEILRASASGLVVDVARRYGVKYKTLLCWRWRYGLSRPAGRVSMVRGKEVLSGQEAAFCRAFPAAYERQLARLPGRRALRLEECIGVDAQSRDHVEHTSSLLGVLCAELFQQPDRLRLRELLREV